MKMKIILLITSAFLVGSLVFNIVQYQNNNTLSNQIELKKQEIELAYSTNSELNEQIENLENETLNEETQDSYYPAEVEQKVEALFRAKFDLEIRSQISSGSAVIGDVPKGAIVEVLNSFYGETAGWEIRYKGITGWVPAKIGDFMSDREDAFERLK
jgi:hypothetical protein